MSELICEDKSVGEGAECASGQTVDVHYTGRLTNGTKGPRKNNFRF